MANKDSWFRYTCPWCGATIGSIRELQAIAVKSGKWLTLFRDEDYRCPHCDKEVRVASDGNAWLLLMVPFFVLYVIVKWHNSASGIPMSVIVLSVIAACFGAFKYRSLRHLEKPHGA